MKSKKIRPVIILSPDEMNSHLGTLIVAPLASTIRKYPFRFTVDVDGTQGQIALVLLRAIDKVRIVKAMGMLESKHHDSVLTLLQEMFSK